MKPYIRISLYLCLLMSLLTACREQPAPEVDEDYKQLFPFTGISKAEHSFEDMNRMPCDPDMALSSYRYPGVELTEDRLEYIVTIKCRYTLSSPSEQAYYMLRYIKPDKTMGLASSRPSDRDVAELLTAGREWTQSFRAYSGYPLYLSLNGVAPRGAHITASITAQSVDGLIRIPTLSTEQSQNKEGPNPIPQPYCEYIILP